MSIFNTTNPSDDHPLSREQCAPEVGASMMVGGNIKGQTRVLTTATVLETSKGNFETAIAFGVILLLLAFTINLILTRIQQRERPR